MGIKASNFKQSFKEGDQAEEKFRILMEERGWSCTSATFSENCHKHIDFHLEKEDIKITVDVKGLKRKHRHGDYDYDNILLEYSNVQGRRGWLLGEANLIAFECKGYFLLVDRKQLLAWSEPLIKDLDNPIVNQKGIVPYQARQRRGRKDVWARVPLKDIENNLTCKYIPQNTVQNR